MTLTPPEPLLAAATTKAQAATVRAQRTPMIDQALEKLFELYPHLFGTRFVPLKLGIFQELLSRHPEHFDRKTLKAALGVHTRSTRYLQCLAAHGPRYDLDGTALDVVAPEHVHQALVQLFRRRQARSRSDLRPQLAAQLMKAFDASGLTRLEYRCRVMGKDAEMNAVLEEAFAQRDLGLAKREALLRAFKSSGKTREEFAQMYGLDLIEVGVTLARQPLQNPERGG